MREPLRKTFFRIILPLTFVIMTLLAQGLFLPPFDKQKILLILRSIVFIVLTFELGWLVVQQVQKRYPLLQQTRVRLIVSYLSVVAVAFVIISLSTLLGRLATPKSFSFAYESLFNFLQCIWFGVLIAAPAEMLYAYQLSFRKELEKNELEKMNLQVQLEALQAQMNPHFLFNTLNTLTSLIAKDPGRAEDFAVEMAHVYRYMLKNINERLISLREELDFVRAYLHLLQVRFGDEVSVSLAIDEACFESQLPPLTLQLLVENAIKHNQASVEKPLRICIQNKGLDQVEVSNTLQRKNGAIVSSGVGLSSLQMRYQLLGSPPVQVSTTDNQFSVYVTLFQQHGKKNLPH